MRRALLFLAAALLLASACGAAEQVRGTALAGRLAPDFRLSDAQGRPVALSDYRGRPLVLTFLYTECPDECPLIAGKLSTVAQTLGSEMDRAAFVAVSVDPLNDTPAAAAAFVNRYQLAGRLAYLIGSEGELRPVWEAYFVGVQQPGQGAALLHEKEIGHTARVIVIDKNGKERANFGSEFKADDMVHNLRLLLKE